MAAPRLMDSMSRVEFSGKDTNRHNMCTPYAYIKNRQRDLPAPSDCAEDLHVKVGENARHARKRRALPGWPFSKLTILTTLTKSGVLAAYEHLVYLNRQISSSTPTQSPC